MNETQAYRAAMIDELLAANDDGALFKVKITSENGDTKWMDIDRTELLGIEWALTLNESEA